MGRYEHVAIVGCGFTGTSAFYQLVAKYPVKRITIFEASGEFGPGYPYRTDECPDYLINNTTDSLCLVPSNRRAFHTWLKSRPDIAPQVEEKGHLPRRAFGAFLKDVVRSTQTVAAIKGIEVELIAEEVMGLQQRADGRVMLRTATRECGADAALLTIGRCPDVDPYPAPPPGSGTLYFANHIHTAALDAIPLDAKVHVLGTSLSAYDVVNRLFAADTGCRFERRDGALTFVPGENARRVVLASRNGRLKNMQSRYPSKISRTRLTPEAMCARGKGATTLADAVAAIRDEATAHGAAIDWGAVADPYAGCVSEADVTWRAATLLEQAIARAADPAGRNFLVDLFANAQADIWAMFAAQLLAADQERLYRERYENPTLTYAAPCPISTAEKLLALMRAGRLSVLNGVSGVTLDESSGAYRIAHAYGVAEARVLVNTTGSVDRDVTSVKQPALVRDLVQQDLLRPYERDGHAMKGAAVDMVTFRVEGTQNVYLASMLLWGPGFFTSSAFMMASVVERLLAGLYGPETAEQRNTS